MGLESGEAVKASGQTKPECGVMNLVLQATLNSYSHYERATIGTPVGNV